MPPESPITPAKPRYRGVIAAAALAAVAGLGILASQRGWLGHADEETDEAVPAEVPVRVGTLTKATLRRTIDAYGTVGPDAAHDGLPPAGAHLAAPVAGVLARLACSEGERVEAGAPLFQLDARSASAEERKAAAAVDSSKAVIARLQLAVDHAQVEYERTKRMQGQGLASDKDVREAELTLGSAKQALTEANVKTAESAQALGATHVARSLMTIHAPLAGTVVRVHVSPGEAVDAATVLADIVDLDRLVVAAQVPAAELGLLKVGQAVELEVPGAKGDADAGAPDAIGTISFIGLEVDPKTGTATVRASIPKGAPLRPGQYLRARIVVEEHAGCLAAPEQAVVVAPEIGPVIAVIEGDTAKLHPVKVGLRERGLVEVSGEGLAEGLKIAVEGAYGMPKEAKIRVVEE